MTAFGGFPPATTRFLGELRANNRKDWFDAHRADYEAHWVAPAKAFVVAAGQQLAELAPEHLGVGAGCHGLDPERLAGSARRWPTPPAAPSWPASPSVWRRPATSWVAPCSSGRPRASSTAARAGVSWSTRPCSSTTTSRR